MPRLENEDEHRKTLAAAVAAGAILTGVADAATTEMKCPNGWTAT